MATDKKSFILYCDLIHTIEKMPADKAGELFKHILRYVNDLNPETDDLIVQLTFEPIKQQLKRDLKDWESTRKKRSDAGKLGMESRWHSDDNNNSKDSNVITKDNNVINDITKITVTDTVTVTVNEIIYYINTVLERKFKPSKKLQEKFNARLKEGYTVEDIKLAFDNAKDDEFHKSSDYKYLTPEFILRQDKLDKWANVKQPTQTSQRHVAV